MINIRAIGWPRIVLVICVLFGTSTYAQGQDVIVRCAFNKNQGTKVCYSVAGVRGHISGYHTYVKGVSGEAIRFDGYTTGITIPAQKAPPVSTRGFTLEAWIALNTYPWNWVPVIDRERKREEGYSFGIDAFGHVGLGISINGQWRQVISNATLPLKKWEHITGTYQSYHGRGTIKVYIDGRAAGMLTVHGQFTPAHDDIVVGRVRRATLPFPQAAIHPDHPVKYSLDGILNDVEIRDGSSNASEVAKSLGSAQYPHGDILPWQEMPSGPPGGGRFGAYYTTLHYEPTWDRLRRMGPDSDVVVRFDESPMRLVFWQGTNYIPVWVTPNDKMYTDEFLETWGHGCPLGGDCEPMSDKHSRYSHVSILESNPARVVIHWRYALTEVEKYKLGWRDPETGWGDWVDEYWTVYPDGIAVREQILHSTDINKPHEWQETIVLNQPGSRPDDDINWNAITLENMEGKTQTYWWHSKPAGTFMRPVVTPPKFIGPANANIQIVNLKSKWKAFQIFSPKGGTTANIYDDENSYFNFECWNHWPVAQIASSGRPCVAHDRPSHTSLSHLYWKAYSKGPDIETKLLMDGLTTRSVSELIPIAKSWLSPPKMEVNRAGFQNDGYDPTQRAYVLTKTGSSSDRSVLLTFQGSAAQPIFDPAIVIKNWGKAGARLTVNGMRVAWGKYYRIGHIHRLEGTDLVIWMRKRSTEPLEVDISTAAQ